MTVGAEVLFVLDELFVMRGLELAGTDCGNPEEPVSAGICSGLIFSVLNKLVCPTFDFLALAK